MDKAMELHKALVEAAAENDEGLMEKFFEQDSLPKMKCVKESVKGLRLVECSLSSVYVRVRIWVYAV